MGKVLVRNMIFCERYEEARTISKAYENFKIHWIDFGESKKVKAKRYVRKQSEKCYCVSVYYEFKYKGMFEDYGFVDEWTKQRFPQLIEELKKSNEKWKVIQRYSRKINDYHDIFFYENFENYVKESLSEYLEKIYVMGEILFAGKYDTGNFCICFDTYEGNFEMGRFLKKIESLETHIEKIPELCNMKYLMASQIWNWMDEYYYCKEDDDYSEARVITAYSYVLNRTPFEVLLYAVIGLESALTDEKEKRGIKLQLKEILPRMFAFISEEDVSQMYKMRSEFVHGDIEFPNYYRKGIMRYEEFKYIEFARKAKLALVLTINELVKRNSTKIRIIDNEIVYQKSKTLREASAEWDLLEDELL